MGSRCDPFLLYGISEIASRVGIDFKQISNYHELPKDPLALIVPEVSHEDDGLEDLLPDFEHSVILVGPSSSPKLDALFGVKSLGERDLYPDVSCLMKSRRFRTPLPVFYSVPRFQKIDPLVDVTAELQIDETEYPGVVLMRKENRLLARIGPQIFRSTAFLLTNSGLQASPSVDTSKLDSYERVGLESTIVHKRGYLQTPAVDYYAQLIEDLLLEIAATKGVPLLQKWAIPGPYNFCLCLSHDIDYLVPHPKELALSILFDVSEVKIRRVAARLALALFCAVSAVITRNRDSLALVPHGLHRRLRKYEPFWRLDEIQKWEAQLGTRSSFFFLHNGTHMDSNYDLENTIVSDAMKQASIEGFEVCLHADFGATDIEKLEWRKRVIEEATGSNVIGVRAHYLRISYPDTFRLYANAGLAYDSSVMFPEEVGFRSSTCTPWKVFDTEAQKTLPLLEIPLIIMDRTLKQEKYMNLNPDAALKVCSALIKQVADLHGVLTVDWHNSGVSLKPSQDRDWWDVYRTIILESMKNGSKVMKLGDVFAYYSMRRRARMEVVRYDRNSCDIKIFSEQEFPEFAISISKSDEISTASLNGEPLPKIAVTKVGGERYIVTLRLKGGENYLSLRNGGGHNV